jgi:hypothetical protein
MDKVNQYRKAIVAVVGAVVAVLAAFGVVVDSGVSQAVVAVATAAFVYLVPNG